MDKDAVYYCKAQWIYNQPPSVQIPSTEEGVKGITGSGQLWGHHAGPLLLLHAWQQRGLRHAAGLQKPRQHLLRVVQIQDNTVISRGDGSELSVLSTGCESRGTGKATQEEHGTEGVGKGASRPSQEGICRAKSKAGKCSNEGEWEQGGRLGDEAQSRKGKG